MGASFAYYKWLKLGDFIRSHHINLHVPGESVEFRPVIAAAIPAISEKGGNSYFQAKFITYLKLALSETDTAFARRKVTFGINCAIVRSNYPGAGASQSGTLAIGDDDAAIKTTVSSETAGTDVQIAVTDGTSGVANEKWFITDGTNYELATCNSSLIFGAIQIGTLVNSYGAGAKMFKPVYAIPGCYIDGDVDVPGNEVGTFETVEVKMDFRSVEAAVWGV